MASHQLKPRYFSRWEQSIILKRRNLLWLCSLAGMGTGQTKKWTALSNRAALFEVQVTGAAQLGSFPLGFPGDTEFMGITHNNCINWLISKDFGKFCKSPQPLKGAKASARLGIPSGKKKCCSCCCHPAQSQASHGAKGLPTKLMLFQDFQESASIIQDETFWVFDFAQCHTRELKAEGFGGGGGSLLL